MLRGAGQGGIAFPPPRPLVLPRTTPHAWFGVGEDFETRRTSTPAIRFFRMRFLRRVEFPARHREVRAAFVAIFSGHWSAWIFSSSRGRIRRMRPREQGPGTCPWRGAGGALLVKPHSRGISRHPRCITAHNF